MAKYILVFSPIRWSKLAEHVRSSQNMPVFRTITLTAMLILLSIVFIICTGPGAIYIPLVFPKVYHETGDRSQIPVAMFLYGLLNCLSGLNASLNFLLYFLSGSKFRKEVKRFFTCKENSRTKVFAITANQHVVTS